MDIDDTKSYPFVLQLLVEVADILSSAEYREFDGKFGGGQEFMAHTLIAYVFNIFSLFVKTTKTPAVTRHAKACNELNPEYLKMPVMIQKKSINFPFHSFSFVFTSIFTNCRVSLLEQLQICIVISSVCNLFAKPPNSFFTFCPALASRYARFVRSDGSTGRRGW